AILLAMPLWFSKLTYEQFELPKINLLWWLTAFLIVTWSIARLNPHNTSSRLRNFDICLALYCLWLGVATFFSISHIASLLGAYRSFQNVFTLLVAPLLAWVASRAIRKEDQIRWVAWMAVAAGTAAALYGVCQQFGWDPVDWARGTMVTSTLGNRNHLGAYLCLAIPLAISLAIGEKRSDLRTAWLVSVVLMVITLILSLTRGAWLGFIAGFGVMVPVYLRRASRQEVLRYTPWVAGILALSLAVSAGVYATMSEKNREDIHSKIVTMLDPRSESAASRIYFWTAALNALKDRPLFGVGPATFYWAYLIYHPTESEASINAINIVPDSPHNIHVEGLMNSGLVGYALYLALLGYFFQSVLKILRSPQVPPGVRHLFVGCCGSLVAFLVDGFFQVDIIATKILSWVLIGVTVGYAASLDSAQGSGSTRTIGARGSARSSVSRQGKFYVVGLSAAVSLAMLAFTTIRMVADWHYREASTQRDGARDLGAAIKDYEIAHILEPYEREYAKDLADAYFMRSDEGSDREYLLHARRKAEYLVRLFPRDGYVSATLAKICLADKSAQSQASTDTAIEELRKAVLDAPNVALFHFNLALALAKKGTQNSLAEREKLKCLVESSEELQKVIAIHPQFPDARKSLEEVNGLLLKREFGG
ncbi:MAG: O-antigen ligase family protein, partial [Armatimonadetes bacterium]|nr:O-antigen ligase family protein [Armatimonadota bacterium]